MFIAEFAFATCEAASVAALSRATSPPAGFQPGGNPSRTEGSAAPRTVMQEDPSLTTSIRQAREEQSVRATQRLLRALLSAYQERFDELDTRRFRLRSQRMLARRFLTGHVDETVTTLERSLHGKSAVDGGTTARTAMLEDLAHFRSSLEPPLSVFTRTLIVLLIAFVAQLLGHLPLIPVVSGPESKPALGSLSEAIDMDPGHVAKALSDLLGSPISTICGAAATAAAAAFLVLGPCIPAFRGKQKLVEGTESLISEHATRPSIEQLERELFSKLSAAVPRRQRVDRLVWWCVATFAVSLGIAWYAAYARGLFRETPSSQNWAAVPELRRPAVLQEPTVIVRTEHPRTLAVGGALFITLGALIALILRSQEREWSFGHVTAGSRRRLLHLVTGGTVMVAVSIVSVSGFSSFELPWARSYNDPHLEARTHRLGVLSLLARPMIPLQLRCRPEHCTIVKATIAEGIPANDVDQLAPGTPIVIHTPLHSDEQLPTKHLSARDAARKFGVSESLIRSLPKHRVAVEQTTLVQITRQVRESFPGERLTAASGSQPRSRDGNSESFTKNVRQTIITSQNLNDQYAIALGDDDLRRLLALSGRGWKAPVASVEVSVRMRGEVPRVIWLPLLWAPSMAWIDDVDEICQRLREEALHGPTRFVGLNSTPAFANAAQSLRKLRKPQAVAARLERAAADFKAGSRYSGRQIAVPAAREERKARAILVSLGARDCASPVLRGD